MKSKSKKNSTPEVVKTPEQIALEAAQEERNKRQYDRFRCCEGWRTNIAVIEQDDEAQCETLVIKRARVERIEEYGTGKVLAFVRLEDDTRLSVEWPRFGAHVDEMEKQRKELSAQLERAKRKIAEAEDRVKRGWSTNSCGILQSTAIDIEIANALYCAAVDRASFRTV